MTDHPTPSPDALRRIGAGLGSVQRRDRATRLASAFKHDPEFEQYIKWRTQDPARYARLPAGVLLALGYYESSRQAAHDALPTERERLEFRRRGGAPPPDDAA